MQVAVILKPPPSTEDRRQAFGGELGTTFMAGGVRVFIAEDAAEQDMLNAADFLAKLAGTLPIPGGGEE